MENCLGLVLHHNFIAKSIAAIEKDMTHPVHESQTHIFNIDKQLQVIVTVVSPQADSPVRHVPNLPAPTNTDHVSTIRKMREQLEQALAELNREGRATSPVEKAKAILAQALGKNETNRPLRNITIPAASESSFDAIPDLSPADYIFVLVEKLPIHTTDLQVLDTLKELLGKDFKVFDVAIIQHQNSIYGVLLSKGSAHVLIASNQVDQILGLHHKLFISSSAKRSIQIEERQATHGDFVCKQVKIPVTAHTLATIRAKREKKTAAHQ